ncbi:MAG: alkene reductase [Leucobacter sp.]
MNALFDSFDLGRLALPNRIVMAPMTRNRATDAGLPTDSFAAYYSQRATAGLIISEGLQPSARSQADPLTPGMHSREQAEAWRPITRAVHEAGGRIFAQLMHGGRIGHPTIGGEVPVAPSAVPPDVRIYTSEWIEPVTPRALEAAEIVGEIEVFARSAELAIEAGFDGVELHGANGYLLQQFLSTNTNRREDAYGGAVNGRIRFVVEAVEAAVAAVGADRVGLRISPGGRFNDIAETDTAEVYPALIRALAPLRIAYLHSMSTSPDAFNRELMDLWPTAFMINPAIVDGAHTADQADGVRWLEQGADLVSYGRAFLANPDLVERLRIGAELNVPDRDTFYEGGDRGYIDYPSLASLGGVRS